MRAILSPQRDGEIANEARGKGVGLFDAQLLPGAHVVRAFNAVSAARMASAHEDPGKIGMPIAGDDKKAIEVASRLGTRGRLRTCRRRWARDG